MLKKYMALILFYSSIALGSFDSKERKLIDALCDQYAACQKQWNKVSRALSRGNLKAYKAAKRQARSQEYSKRQAEKTLCAYQTQRNS